MPVIDKIESTNNVSGNSKKQISKLLSESSSWSVAKSHGINKLKGAPRRDCKKLLEECCKIGLFIVPIGEMEAWWRDGSADKNKWILEALTAVSKNLSPFEEVSKFMTQVHTYLD